MIDDDKLPEGATPLDPDEAEGLIPGLTTRGELNTFEQRNIARAVAWSRSSKKLRSTLFEIESLKFLHKRMFDETWKWAGKFRLTGKNIGVEPAQIHGVIKVPGRDLNASADVSLPNFLPPSEQYRDVHLTVPISKL